jgi:hypothetical protein
MGHLDGNDDGVGYGVRGTGNNTLKHEGSGVRGTNPKGTYGVYGDAAVFGVYGTATAANAVGVRGECAFNTGIGVAGLGPDGVIGISETGGNGVTGRSSNVTGSGTTGNGVWGETTSSFQPGAVATAGVWGNNLGSGPGVKGTSISGDAIIGVSTSNVHAGVSAVNDSGGFGMWARGTPAGHFEGDVEISGNVAVGVGSVDPSFLANTRMVVGGNSGGSAAPNDLACFGAPVNGIPQGQIVISPDVPFIEVAGLEPLIELRSSDQVLQIGPGGIATPSGFRIGLGFPDKNAITIDSDVGGLVINSSLTVNGNAKFQGGKQGFLVDEFVNCSETVLERGDLLTLRRTEAKERYGDRIPVPQVELAREAYAVEVCGVVDGPALQPEHRCHDAVSAEVPPGARGLMVTIGCYADCKVDADVVPIEVGDLLTASSTPGHAQRVLDRSRAIGAIVGKALKAVEKGKATIPILVLLH